MIGEEKSKLKKVEWSEGNQYIHREKQELEREKEEVNTRI